MPQQNGMDIGRFAQIDLHPLRAGPSSTHEPSVASLSPSVTRSSEPMIGFMSLEVTVFLNDKLVVPRGTRNAGRGLPVGLSTVVPGGIFFGVPVKAGRGREIFKGTRFALAAGFFAAGFLAAAFFAGAFLAGAACVAGAMIKPEATIVDRAPAEITFFQFIVFRSPDADSKRVCQV
jgi:hypothetical protein